MSKKKETKKKQTKKEVFNLNEALDGLNEFIRPNFHWYLINNKLEPRNQKEFDKYYKVYNGGK